MLCDILILLRDRLGIFNSPKSFAFCTRQRFIVACFLTGFAALANRWIGICASRCRLSRRSAFIHGSFSLANANALALASYLVLLRALHLVNTTSQRPTCFPFFRTSFARAGCRRSFSQFDSETRYASDEAKSGRRDEDLYLAERLMERDHVSSVILGPVPGPVPSICSRLICWQILGTRPRTTEK